MAFLAMMSFAPGGAATAGIAKPVPVALGHSVFVLNGPWKFHVGDDPRWADPRFDDSAWENVDLTPPPGAHDGDVGLSGYVPGWSARGHAGYLGYAWYRMRVSVTALQGDMLAMTGPPDVDSAYQFFVDGRLAGEDGVFSGATPVIYSIQPKMFALPRARSGDTFVLVFRVWMGAFSYGPDGGGIHIAPALGEAGAIDARYRLEWQQTVAGYIVDATEPIVFVLLAMMAASLFAFDRSDEACLWLAGALLLTAALRANQVTFFWTQSESLQTFDLARNVLLTPLGLGAWTLAWHAWFRLHQPAWLPTAIGVFTLLYVISQLLGRSWVSVPHTLGAVSQDASVCLRLVFVLLTAFVVYLGVRRQGREAWFALPAIVLVSVGLFAQELSVLHVPGIWFPFGVGVSRTEYAYAGLGVALFALLLRRLLQYARNYQMRPA